MRKEHSEKDLVRTTMKPLMSNSKRARSSTAVTEPVASQLDHGIPHSRPHVVVGRSGCWTVTHCWGGLPGCGTEERQPVLSRLPPGMPAGEGLGKGLGLGCGRSTAPAARLCTRGVELLCA